MLARESTSMTDYIYFPIEYPTKVYSTVLTPNLMCPVNDTWVIPIDKSKFICGINNDTRTGTNLGIINLLSIGF